MIIKRERLFAVLVVDHQRAQRRVGFKGGNQVKPQTTLEHARFGHPVTRDDILVRRTTEQLAVKGARQRVALRDAGGLHILVGGGNKDGIRLIKITLVTRQFVGVILPVNLQVQVAAIDAVEAIVCVYPKRQVPVDIRFIGNCRTNES